MCDMTRGDTSLMRKALKRADRRADGAWVSKPWLVQAGALEDIPNSDGLRGAASRGFVTIAGPCGDHHTLSWSAACALYSWLGRKLSADAAMNAHVPKHSEWISDALAKERAHG